MRGLLVWAAVFLLLASAGCIAVQEHSEAGPATTPVPAGVSPSPVTTPATPVIPGGTPAPLITPGPDAKPDPRQRIPSCDSWNCSRNCSEFPQTPADWDCWYCQDKMCRTPG